MLGVHNGCGGQFVAWQEGDITVNGARLHYYRRGQGVPLVLVHGATESGPSCWMRVAEAFEGAYDVVAYDARCHGRSESVSYAGGDSGDDLIGVVEALGLDRPFAWGHSMGAMATAHAVARRPDLFRGGVVEDPGWGLKIPLAPDGSLDRKGMGQQIIDSARALHEQPLEDLIAEIAASTPTLRADEVRARAEAKHQFRPVDEWSGAAHEANPWRSTVERFQVPVLLLCGDVEQGAIVPQEISDEAARMSAVLEVARFPTGHMVHEQAFEECIPLVREFLARTAMTPKAA
jgi:pimeloyl-ACP methyl ester carboxylesterase